MIIKASHLRENIYNLLDNVASTGVPIEINRKGKKLKIILDEKHSKLSNLKKRQGLHCDPEEIVEMDWSAEWEYGQ